MIVFTKSLNENELLQSYNNNVIEFHSDSSLQPINCVLNLGGLKTVIIYPSPSGSFYFNFKDYINSFIESNKFLDTYNLQVANVEVDWTSKVFKNINIEIQINFIDTTFENENLDLSFLSSFSQIFNKKTLSKNDVYLLHNLKSDTYYYNFWDGYPFEIDFYNGPDLPIILMKNTTIQYELAENYIVNRCFLDKNNLGLSKGVNELNVYTYDKICNLTINNKSDICGGVYVKWINSLGGWDYFLFSKPNKDLQTSDLGELENDFNNLNKTTNKYIQIGKTTFEKWQVTTDVLEPYEVEILKDFFESPKIYIFLGQKNIPTTFNQWVEVNLTNSNYNIEKAKQNLNNFNLTFELPKNYNRII